MTMLTDVTAQAQGDAPVVKLQRVGETIYYGNVVDWLYVSNIPNDPMNGQTFTDALPTWAAKMPEVGQWLYVPTTTAKTKKTRNRRDSAGMTKEERAREREREREQKAAIAVERAREKAAAISELAMGESKYVKDAREKRAARHAKHAENGAIRRAREDARKTARQRNETIYNIRQVWREELKPPYKQPRAIFFFVGKKTQPSQEGLAYGAPLWRPRPSGRWALYAHQHDAAYIARLGTPNDETPHIYPLW